MGGLTWDDLTIQTNSLDIVELYEDWNWLIKGSIRPIMMSTFGDLFYLKKDKRVYYLDTIEGLEKRVAKDEKSFYGFINDVANQEKYLLSYHVLMLKNSGLTIGENQCYAFKILPVLGGKIEIENIEVMDLAAWLSITGQIHRQVKSLPKGTLINGIKIVD